MTAASPSTRLARTLALAVLLAGTVACDQATKRLAEAELPPGRRVSLLGDTLRLELVHNPGAFLGLGRGLPKGARRGVFTYGVALITLAACVFAFHPRTAGRAAAAAALVAAGGLGNLWDRLTTGGWVVDFLNVGVGGLRTGIFNVADVAIMAGAVLLLFERRHRAPGPG